MARYSIAAPDGNTYEIDGPAGATQDQIQAEVLRQHPEAGKPRAAPAKAAPQSSFLDRLWTATKGDAGAVLEGIGQTADFLTNPKVVETLAASTGPFGPVIAPYAGKAAAAINRTGLTGHAAQAVANVIPETNQIPSIVRTGLNLAGGAAIPLPEAKFAEEAFNPAVTKAAKGLAADAGTVTTKTGQAVTKRGVLPDAADVVAQGKAADVPVLTTDVKPPQSTPGTFFKQTLPEKMPILGMAGQRAAQQTARKDAAIKLVDEFGGDTSRVSFDDTTSPVDDLAKNLSDTRAARITALATAKNTVINGVGGDVPTPNTVQAIGQQIRRLQGINADAFAPVIQKLQDFGTALTSGKSLAEIEGNRKLLGDMFKDPNLASIAGDGQKAINALYDPLRQDMGSYIKKQAGDSAYARWSQANKQLSSMMDDLDASKFKNVLKNSETTPEAVGRLLFSKDPSDVRRLVSNLDAQGLAKAKTAIVQRVFDNSISANEGLSPERFVANMRGVSNQIGIVFKPEEASRVRGLVRLLDVTRRASAAGFTPRTGEQNTLTIAAAALGHALGLSGGLAALGGGGMLARLYESPMTRNLLIGLGKTKAGSPTERVIFKRILQTKALQVGLASSNLTSAANDALAQSPGRAAAQDEPNGGPEPPQ